VPENWEFDVKGYTNVSGGMTIDPKWAAADRAASDQAAQKGTLNGARLFEIRTGELYPK